MENEPIEIESVKTSELLIQRGLVADDTRAGLLGQPTPKNQIYTRPGKGGGKWKYIKGDYVIRLLNTIFTFQWDFELIPMKEGELFLISSRQIIVVGKLTIKDATGTPRIVKTATGKKDIAYTNATDPLTGKKSQTTTPLDLGNDIKAAETDALKRAAAKLGIGLDLYKDENIQPKKEYNEYAQ